MPDQGVDDPSEVERGSSSDRDYAVRAVDRVCAILSLLQARADGVHLAEVAQATELPKSSAFRYLRTLEFHQYVERDPAHGTFRLGMSFVDGQSHRLEILRKRARPTLERLRDALQETVNLGQLDGTYVTYLEILESPRAVRLAARRGDREPLHATALGKAICAQLGDARVARMLEESGMPALTASTITTVPGYLAELDRVRDHGFAVDDAENEPDGRCVAVALAAPFSLAAISVSAPAARFPRRNVEAVARRLRAAAEEIARRD